MQAGRLRDRVVVQNITTSRILLVSLLKRGMTVRVHGQKSKASVAVKL